MNKRLRSVSVSFDLLDAWLTGRCSTEGKQSSAPDDLAVVSVHMDRYVPKTAVLVCSSAEFEEIQEGEMPPPLDIVIDEPSDDPA